MNLRYPRAIRVSPDLAGQIAPFGVREGVTPYVVLLAAFALLLHQHSGQKDVVVCLPVSGRHRGQTRDVIGYFNNILPIRLDLNGNPTLRQVLARVNLAVREAFDHQDVPFQQIAELPALALIPLTRCLFSLQSIGALALKLPEIKSTYDDVHSGAADFPLSVFLEEKDDELKGLVDYRTDRFSTPRIEELMERYQRLVRRMIEAPEVCLEQLPGFCSPISGTSGSAHLPGMEAPARESQTIPKEYTTPVSPLPRSELERQLIRLWEDVLGIRPIRRDSNFFDLGGHSLLAARLFAPWRASSADLSPSPCSCEHPRSLP